MSVKNEVHRSLSAALGLALTLQSWSCGSSEPDAGQMPTVTLPGGTQTANTTPTGSGLEPGPGPTTSAGPSTNQTQGTSSTPTQTTGLESGSDASGTLSTSATSTPGSSSTTDTPSIDTSSNSNSETDSSSAPPPRKLYTEGHGDIAVYFEEAKDDIRVAIDVEDSLIDGVFTTEEFPVQQLLIRTGAQFTRPDEDTDGLLAGTCVERNKSIAWLPQNNTDCHRLKTPFLGWANRIRPRDLEGEYMSIRITRVDAPAPGGHLSVWRSVFPPEFMVSTCDGLDGDEVKLYSGHDHYNIGFAGPKGRWTGHFEVELTMATTKKTYRKAFSIDFLVE